MIKQNKSLFSAIGAIFLFFTISLTVSTLFVKNREDLRQGEQDNYLELSREKTYHQRFVARHDDLNIILLSLRNPGLASKEKYQISLSSEDGETLAQQTISGLNIGDPCQFRFQFPPISNSKNKPFTLVIETLTESVGEKYGLKPGLGIKEGTIANFNYLQINDQEYKGVVTFSTYYRNNNKLESAKDFIVRLQKNFTNDPLFSTMWLTVIFYLLILIKKSCLENPNK